MLRSNCKQSEKSVGRSRRRKEKTTVGEICLKERFKTGVKERVMNGESGESTEEEVVSIIACLQHVN